MKNNLQFCRPYKVSIPKFSIKTSYSLKEVIADMGITDIFSQTANFKGISDDQLSVSKVRVSWNARMFLRHFKLKFSNSLQIFMYLEKMFYAS